MTDKKLYEMTPEETAELTDEELEEKTFEMVTEMSGKAAYSMIRTHAKEKLLRGKTPDCIFYRFFYCDIDESFTATQKIFAAAARGDNEEAGEEMDKILRVLIDYAEYYAEMCSYEPQKIIDDISIFIDTLELTANDKGKYSFTLHDVFPEYMKLGDTIHLGWGLKVGGEYPETVFDTVYGELTSAIEIALLALWKIFAPREAFKSVYAKIAEKALKYGKPERDLKEYTEKNDDFDFWFEDEKTKETQEFSLIEAENGQQAFKDAFPEVGKAIELTPRTPLSDVFRRGGIPKSAFDRTYSPARYKGDGFTAVIEKIDELKNSLSDRADKLLSSIEAAYINSHPSDNIVYIDFLDFCDKCKYNTSKSSIRMTKSLIKSDLKDISLLKFSANGKNGDFINVPFIGTNGVITPKIGNPYIMCAVDPVYAKMMNKGQLTPYPRTVYQYSGTPYNIVKKLYEHFSMDSNAQKGTNDILSVKSILTASGLKETPRTIKLWRSEIKERLEDALEKLHQGGDLIKWEYCKAKKEKLTSKEKDNIVNNTYANYIGLYIRFELKNVSDESERRARNEERREKLEEKKARAALKDAATVINNENKRKKKQKPKA